MPKHTKKDEVRNSAVKVIAMDLRPIVPFCSFGMLHHAQTFVTIKPANVNNVKTFSAPCYIIQRVLTFVSDVQELVLGDFISQKFA